MALENVAPTVSATLDPAAPNGSAGWYTSPVTVNLTGADNAPGAVSLEYRLDGAAAWTTYTLPVVVSGDGNHIDRVPRDRRGGQRLRRGHVDLQDRRDQAGRHGERRHQRLDRG